MTNGASHAAPGAYARRRAIAVNERAAQRAGAGMCSSASIAVTELPRITTMPRGSLSEVAVSLTASSRTRLRN